MSENIKIDEYIEIKCHPTGFGNASPNSPYCNYREEIRRGLQKISRTEKNIFIDFILFISKTRILSKNGKEIEGNDIDNLCKGFCDAVSDFSGKYSRILYNGITATERQIRQLQPIILWVDNLDEEGVIMHIKDFDENSVKEKLTNWRKIITEREEDRKNKK